MPKNIDTAYLYDGSYAGFLTCVFESFERREMPMDIVAESGERLTLFPVRYIATDGEKALRVDRSIPRRMSREGEAFVRDEFLSFLKGRELRLLMFLRLGYQAGPAVLHMLDDDRVALMASAVQHVRNEAHLLRGFTRFSDTGGLLTATIQPYNRVLPLLGPPFSDRYQQQPFLVFDQNHGEALAGQGGHWQVGPLADFQPAPPNAKEQEIRALWRLFYETVAIPGRLNPRLRMSHMPKRYWQYLTELQKAPEDHALLPATATKQGPEAPEY